MRIASWWVFLVAALLATSVHAEAPRDPQFDRSFGTDGRIRLDQQLPSGTIVGRPYEMVEQPDGRLLIFTVATVSTPVTRNFPAVIRLMPDGAIDVSFGASGVFVMPDGQWSLGLGGVAHAGAVLSDGRIVVTGVRYHPQSILDWCVVVFALYSNGDLIDSYGPAEPPGPACIDFGNPVTVFEVNQTLVLGAVRALPDDRVLISGPPGNVTVDGAALARLTTMGRYDTTFGGGDGVLRFGGTFGSLASSLGALLMTATGDFLSIGDASINVAAMKFDSHGNIDPAYGAQGMAQARFGTAYSESHAATIDAQQRLWISGYGQDAQGGFTCGYCIARFLPDGTLDTSFNASATLPGEPGVVRIGPADAPCCVFGIGARSGGRAWLIGSNRPGGVEQTMMVGLTNDGAYDPQFGNIATPGRFRVDYAAIGAIDRQGLSMLTTSDGRAVIASNCRDAATSLDTICLARLTDDVIFGDDHE
jgi:uncharacterized delta-60 repeat protein